jgi:ribosomal protein S18 acetylase RimI-like enzyme
MSAALNFRVAVEGDVEGATASITSAFAGDPVWGRVFGLTDEAGVAERRRRRGVFRRWWRLFVETAVVYEGVWVSSGCEAVAVWVAPGFPEFGPAQEREGEKLIESLPSAQRVYLGETLARFEAARPERTHRYLSLLGVHEDHRGKGIGMALLAHTLKGVDASGDAAYLESTNPANLERYRSVGFNDLSAFTLPDDGPTVTTMWRHSRTGP